MTKGRERRVPAVEGLSRYVGALAPIQRSVQREQRRGMANPRGPDCHSVSARGRKALQRGDLDFLTIPSVRSKTLSLLDKQTVDIANAKHD